MSSQDSFIDSWDAGGQSDKLSIISASDKSNTRGVRRSTSSAMSTPAVSAGSGNLDRVMALELRDSSWLRQQCHGIVSNGTFSSAILVVILLNTFILAIQTTQYLSVNYGMILQVLFLQAPVFTFQRHF
jgi:hypothetical protein